MSDEVRKKSLKVLGVIIAIIYIIVFASCLIGDDKARQYANAEDMIEGHLIKDGVFLPGDSVTALPTIQKLADKQYGPAIWMLAQYYENGSAGIPIDTIEANRLCEHAFPILLKEAESGDMYSQCALSPDFVIVSPKNLRQRVWRFSDALPSALFGYKPPCSKVA